MTRSSARQARAALIAITAAIGPAGATAYAQSSTTAPSAPLAPPEVITEIVPVINTGGSSTTLPWGWTEILVRVQNIGSKPARGVITTRTHRGVDPHGFRATAPYTVGAGATVMVRVPTAVLPYTDTSVDVVDDAFGEVGTQRYTSSGQASIVLFDVNETSRLRAGIHDAYIAPSFVPPGAMTPPSGRGMAILVGSPRFDPTTGDPVLPDRAALYSGADAVFLRTDTLTRLTGAELEALAGYVLGGGTLALTVSRPEDLRHPTLVALVGGEPTKTSVNAATLRPLTLAKPYGAGGSTKVIPSVANPSDDVSPTLVGYSGGNLRGSLFGSSATYGLGEVHMLAFDPTRPQVAGDDWVKGRMLELTRRGYDRRATVVFGPGSVGTSANLTNIRQQLDPNESSRWSIGAAALLLCLYAVAAGPLNFSFASKKGQPLRALRVLPIIAAACFALIVIIGVAAKGIVGRARHLTLVEAGAGMTKGVARRFRGFFASSASDLTVRTTDPASLVSTAVAADSGDSREQLVIDRDGARLTDVAALPWQTIVVREDGFASLGDGIAIVREGTTDLAVINRSGRSMRGAILWTEVGDARYLGRITDGSRVVASTAIDIGASSEGRSWYADVLRTVHAGSISVHQLHAEGLGPLIDKDAPGLSEALYALEAATGDTVDWFPLGVPVLIAQLDGGEGRTSDSGLRLESDRLIVRVVGFGGKP